MQYLKNVVSLSINKDACTGCRKCVDVCPREVLTIVDKKVEITKRDNCIECGACMNNCQFDAIKVAAGVGCAAAMINGIMKYGDPEKGTCDCSSDSGCC